MGGWERVGVALGGPSGRGLLFRRMLSDVSQSWDFLLLTAAAMKLNFKLAVSE